MRVVAVARYLLSEEHGKRRVHLFVGLNLCVYCLLLLFHLRWDFLSLFEFLVNLDRILHHVRRSDQSEARTLDVSWIVAQELVSVYKLQQRKHHMKIQIFRKLRSKVIFDRAAWRGRGVGRAHLVAGALGVA